jgi:hypothetical protein
LNATELARNKFDALFADHDTKAVRSPAKQPKPILKTVKKVIKNDAKTQ